MVLLYLVIVRGNCQCSSPMSKSTACSIFGRNPLVLINTVALIGCPSRAALVMKKNKILVAVVAKPMLTGDASNADPVCSKSKHHGIILAAREEADSAPLGVEQMVFRNEKTSDRKSVV